ncbi:MAG TPA: type II secretion system protein [Myxococcaceae bacterium]|nr:type II secretion system protein [Myxococcaceae bacterium]
MVPPRPRRLAGPFGFTLIELLVTLAIVGVVLSITTSALLGFQQLTNRSHLQRQATAVGRDATAFVEKSLRLAGYGIDPALAFDFNVYRGNGARCLGVGGVTSNGCLGTRDQTVGPDELVFYARNPEYWGEQLNDEPEGRAWRVLGATAGAVRIQSHGGERFPKGQVLQIVCPQAAAIAYVELAVSVDVPDPGAGAIGPAVDLRVETPEMGNPYRQSAVVAGTPCLTDGLARAFFVDRFRYFVAERVLGLGAAPTPFLMLDQGVDRNGDDAIDDADLVAVAQDVVDLQVAYVRPEASATLLRAAGASAPLTFCTSANPRTPGSCANGLRIMDFVSFGAHRYDLFTYFTQQSSNRLRESPDAPNITAVHVSIVTRSQSRTLTIHDQPRVLNLTSRPPAQPRVFKAVEVVVPTPNLQAHALSYY